MSVKTQEQACILSGSLDHEAEQISAGGCAASGSFPQTRRALPDMLNSSSETASKQNKATADFRPDIEGLRAIAVLSVIGFHYGVPWLIQAGLSASMSSS